MSYFDYLKIVVCLTFHSLQDVVKGSYSLWEDGVNFLSLGAKGGENFVRMSNGAGCDVGESNKGISFLVVTVEFPVISTGTVYVKAVLRVLK